MINLTDIPKLNDKQLKGAFETTSDLLKAIVIEQHKRENKGAGQPPFPTLKLLYEKINELL